MPKVTYTLKDGTTEVPSTTTLTGKYKDYSGLLKWYHSEGVLHGQGVPGHDLNQKRDEAGELGGAVHHLIDAYLSGDPPNPLWHHALPHADDVNTVRRMFDEFQEWWSTRQNPRIIATEVSLVSETFKYGGTIDIILDTGLASATIMDWKTGRDFYPEMVMQMAAYAWLAEECMGVIVTQAQIIRLPKSHKHIKPYAPITKPELDVAFAKFLKLRETYDMEDPLNKICERIRRDSKQSSRNSLRH